MLMINKGNKVEMNCKTSRIKTIEKFLGLASLEVQIEGDHDKLEKKDWFQQIEHMQDKVSGKISIFYWHATSIPNALWTPLII